MAEKNGAFELLEQIEKLKDAAYRDYVTGLMNRGAAELYIDNILAQIGQGEACMLIMIDLDNFKMVNDTLGHLTGDKVICTTASILSSLFRPGDVVARLGGDEYIVFLYGNVTKKLARTKGKEICEKLRLTVGEEVQVSISASVGIYFSPDGCSSFEEMYRLADRALYQAKNRGKSQFYIHEKDGGASVNSGRRTRRPPAGVKASKAAEETGGSIAVISYFKPAKVIYADERLCKILGLKEREAVGKKLTDYMHPDDVREFLEIIENPLENKGIYVQVRLRTPKGDWAYSKVKAVSIQEEENRCILLNWRYLPSLERGDSSQREVSFGYGENQNKWELDLLTKEFRFYSSNDFFMPLQKPCIFPDDLIRSGWVGPESADRFMKFAADIYTGKAKGYGNSQIRSGDGKGYVWAALSYWIQGQGNGPPHKVTGRVVPLNTDVQIEKIPFARKAMVPVPVVDGLIVKLDANVTKDSVTKIWMEGGFQEREYYHKNISYFMVSEGCKIYDRSDKVKFTSFFSREHLMELYQKGAYWYFEEYRRTDSAGYVEWAALAMNLYKKTLDDEIQVRLRINTCDDRHMWECFSSQENMRCKETNLYTPQSVRDILKGLQKEAVGELCGAVLIRVDGLAQLSAWEKEREKAIRTREYVVNMLSYTLGTRYLAAQVCQGGYLFLFPDAGSPTYINRMLDMAFHYSKILLSDIMPVQEVHFFAAVACAPLKNADYDSLLSMCQALWRDYPLVEEDKIVFHRSVGEKEQEEKNRPDFDQLVAVIEPGDGSLSEEELGLFSDCLSDMLLAPLPEKGMLAMFQRLGLYYQADRLYILSLENTSRALHVRCEWKLPHLETIAIMLSRTSRDKLRLLTRCSIEKKPMIFSANAACGQALPEEQWNYCIFPLHFSEQAYMITDFLCIENPKDKEKGYDLVNRLLPYLKNQKLRISSRGELSPAFQKDGLEELPNLMEYINTVPRFLSGQYKTMGAFLAKVPRLAILNSYHGFEYGYGLLCYIRDALAETIGREYLFRTWDNEFIALLPNVGEEEARDKFNKLKVAIDRRYGENVLVNYRWKEKPFTRKDIMDMPKAGTRRRIVDVEKYLRLQMSEPEQPQAETFRYTVYIQPVFEAKTEKLAGAELLVRGIDKKGDIIQPGRFLKNMAYSSLTKNMDLFVLEQALSILDDWEKRGVGKIPLSVNFARETILDNTIIASFLAIKSRYPQLGESRIYIELPQSIGREHYVKLGEIMEQLREFGAEFAIDDIGVDRDNTRILNQLRFDMVKIDRSLIMDMASSEHTRETIRMMASHCMENRASCVAEGVETKEQREAARKLGCGYIQGFYYDKPMPVEEFNQKYMGVSQAV